MKAAHILSIFTGMKPDIMQSISDSQQFKRKTGSLKDWVIDVFGAQNIEPLDLEVGHSVRGVWRPSLYFYEDAFQALGVTEIEMRLSESSLRTLMEKLDVIFQYIKPDST